MIHPVPAQGHTDTYSTSSSTLVNADTADEATGKQNVDILALAAAPIEQSKSRRRASASPRDSLRMSASSPLSSSRRRRDVQSSTAKISFADDHRCSEYETDGGPCPCVLERESSEAGSSGSTSARRIEAVEAGSRFASKIPIAARRTGVALKASADREEEDDEEAQYLKRVVSARRKKMLQESSTSSTPRAPGAFFSSRQSKFVGSDYEKHGTSPRTHQNGNTYHLSRGVESKPAERGMGGSSLAYDEVSNELHSQVATRHGLPQASTPQKSSATSNSPAQSAARKSISNVFERLLKEEEQRREEERERKEAARQRRREDKKRREDESSLLSSSRADSAERLAEGHVAPHLSHDQGLGTAGETSSKSPSRTSHLLRLSALSGQHQKNDRPSPNGDEMSASVSAKRQEGDSSVSTAIARKRVSFSALPDTQDEFSNGQVKSELQETPRSRIANVSRTLKSPFFPGGFRTPAIKTNNGKQLLQLPFDQDPCAELVESGAETWRGDVPRASTPPLDERSKAAIAAEDLDIGDDSIRITVHELMSALRQAKGEPQNLSGMDGNEPDLSSAKRRSLNSREMVVATEAIHEDEQYRARLATVRSRIAQLAKEINIADPPMSSMPQQKSFLHLTWKHLALVVALQGALLYFMLVAAQAEAEQLFLTVHHDPISGSGTIGILPSMTFTTLFGSLLLKMRLLPDPLGISTSPQSAVLAANATRSWTSAVRLAITTAQQPHHRTLALRILLHKLIASLGIEEGDVVTLGHRVPT